MYLRRLKTGVSLQRLLNFVVELLTFLLIILEASGSNPGPDIDYPD
jgi:hypothetical protein